MNNKAKEEATKIIEKYMMLLPDHLGQIEAPIAKSCAREEVKGIINANPTFGVYGLEPQQSSISWWKDVLNAIENV